MIHAVYLAEWLAGEQAQQVTAFVDAPTYAQRQPEVEDLALLQIAFPSGYSTIHIGWGEGVGGVDISGSAGQIRMRYQQGSDKRFQPACRTLQREQLGAYPSPTRQSIDPYGQFGGSFTLLWQDFADAVRQQREPLASRCGWKTRPRNRPGRGSIITHGPNRDASAGR